MSIEENKAIARHLVEEVQNPQNINALDSSLATSYTDLQRLYLFQLSSTSLPLPTGQVVLLSMGCYLIQTKDGKNILVDSGLPADYTSPPEAPPPAKSEKNVMQALAELNLCADDIDILICTHFDPDHAGYHDAFPKAEHIVQRQHYELARSGHQRYASVRLHWDHPALRYRLLDGDTQLLPGLTLVETSGHAPGHQSVLLHLPQTGPVLLAIDAVAMQRAFTPARSASPMDDNEGQLRASTRKLLDLVEHEHIDLVVFHHDGQQWETLKKAPEYYE
jgi:N-acyl homoserine lactone hydrolase